MLVERLTVRQFRNYGDLTVEFAPGGAYITGTNGSGKTNLLEAIYYLANQASFRTARREELQGWGTTSSVVAAVVTDRSMQRQSELMVRLSSRERRLFLNGKETRDVQKFMGYFAAVAFHPGTMNVIKGGPAGRRHLIDRGILSLQPEATRLMQDLQRALKQRNALVRTADAGTPALSVWTERFIEAALALTRLRVEHVACLNITLEELVRRLGEDLGSLMIEYQPAALAKCSSEMHERALAFQDGGQSMRERFLAEAARLHRAEEAIGVTLFGPQRDDFVIRYQGRESRGYASQGEQRLAAFLLVAALAINIHQRRGHRPIVLLDDVVSELDERHRMVIFDFLKTHAFQVFITDVEERPLYRDLSPLTPLRVRQINGRAEVRSSVSDGSILQSPR
jgi:DNA replication and repair protein RecF